MSQRIIDRTEFRLANLVERIASLKEKIKVASKAGRDNRVAVLTDRYERAIDKRDLYKASIRDLRKALSKTQAPAKQARKPRVEATAKSRKPVAKPVAVKHAARPVAKRAAR